MNNDFSFDINAVSRAFKAYDVRGRIPDELNEEVMKRIGNAFIQFLQPIEHPIVVGYDVRSTSKAFVQALIIGITEAGIDVLNIGLVGTDMVYFATAVHHASGGIMITASHNPADYNGLKFVRADAVPVSGDSGLNKIRDLVLQGKYVTASQVGQSQVIDVMDEYIIHILNFVDISSFPSLKVVMNTGNGCAGTILPQLLKKIPQIDAVPVFWEPDGTFPNGIPNPLLPERREDTSKKIMESNADLGVAWDGDFDRCFFYDERGDFVDGYYLVSLFGEFFAKKIPGAKIIHDPRLIWATQEAVRKAKGLPLEFRAGHSFIKENMRKEDAIYAGEMSAHHYFRDNFYADNGMIPMLLLFQILGETKKSLRELVQDWMERFPISGEINVKVSHADAILKRIDAKYKAKASEVRYTDGLSIDYENWRFNLRKSNTEPVIRLNVETRGDITLMKQKKDELLSDIQIFDKA
jgi:phosphomannomutase/phosphomannomutase/phosphoglucomutase